MSQLQAGDPVCLSVLDGLVYPVNTTGEAWGGRIYGFVTSRETENIDEAWIRVVGPTVHAAEHLCKLGAGYWVDTPGPYAPPEGDDVTLLDAIEVYLSHK